MAGSYRKTHTQKLALPALTRREHATVLAALRYWQREAIGPPAAATPEWELRIATNMGEFRRPLDRLEIDKLCERLNCEVVPLDPDYRALVGRITETMQRALDSNPKVDKRLYTSARDQAQIAAAETYSCDRLTVDDPETQEILTLILDTGASLIRDKHGFKLCSRRSGGGFTVRLDTKTDVLATLRQWKGREPSA
jgi:hypothetical protein